MSPVENTDEVVKLIWNLATFTDLKGIRQSIQVYRDDFYDIVKDELGAQFSDPAVRARLIPLISTELNLCKTIVNQTAVVYKEAASRSAKVGEKNDTRYDDIVKESNLNSVMKSANRYTRLLNHVLIRPVVRRGEMQYDIILPDNFEIFTDEDDWKEIIAVRYYTGTVNPVESGFRSDSSMAQIQREEAYLWVSKRCAIPIDGSMVTLDPGIYEYKCSGGGFRNAKFTDFPYFNEKKEAELPFVLLHKEYPVDSLLNFTRDSGMVDATINVNIYVTMLNELMKFQSFKQTAITGDFTLPDKLQTGPGSIWQIKSTGGTNQANIDILDMQAQIKELWDVIKERVSLCMAQYGIPPSAFTLTGNPASGYALKVDRRSLDEIRENDIEIYRPIEEELFEITRIVNNTDNPSKPISKDAVFSIDFAESKYPDNPTEENTRWQGRITNGVATPIDWIMSDNPDLTREDATKQYLANKALMAQRATAPLVQPGQAPQ